MTIGSSKSTSFRSLLVSASLAALVLGCSADDGAADTGSDDEEAPVAAQSVAPLADAGAVSSTGSSGSAGSTASSNATQTRCAIAYTDCLLGAWASVLTPRGLKPVTECTAKAEACGLFDNAPDAGTDLTPSCGMEIADCYLKNPGDASKCSDLPCRASGSSATTP